jgi:hypothetical protein
LIGVNQLANLIGAERAPIDCIGLWHPHVLCRIVGFRKEKQAGPAGTEFGVWPVSGNPELIVAREEPCERALHP